MSPTVVGPLVTVGSCAGKLYAFRLSTGDLVWQHDVSMDGATQFHGNPAWVAGRLIIGTDEGSENRGNLYAFDPQTGSLFWKKSLDPGLPSNVCAPDSLVYVGSKDDEVRAVSVRTGREEWSFRAEADPEAGFWRLVSSPLMVGDLVIYADRNRNVFALDAATGTPRWSTRLDARITTQPCAIDSTVVFGTKARSLVSLRVADGRVTHRQELTSIPTGTMSVREHVLYFLAAGETDQPRRVVALDWQRQEILWDAFLDDPDPTASWFVLRLPFWKDDVLVGSSGGLLVAYQALSGQESWRIHLSGAIRGIGSTPEMLFVGTLEGNLFALRRP